MAAAPFLKALWGVVSAAEASLPFGYLEYALQRLDQYYCLKAQLVEARAAETAAAATAAAAEAPGARAAEA